MPPAPGRLAPRALVLACLAAGCAACSSLNDSLYGGDPTSPGTLGDAGAGTDQPDPLAPGSLEGSYDLAFTAAAPVATDGGPTLPEGVTIASASVRGRLDLGRGDDGALRAVITGRWGDAAAYAVVERPGALVLTGDASFGPSTDRASTVDRWTTVTLARASDGTLTGAVTARGDATYGLADQVWSVPLDGSGRLSPDSTAPELRVAKASRLGPEDALLPWEPAVVRAAEPVPEDGLHAASTLTGADGAPVALAFAAQPEAGARSTWAGVTRVEARLADWTAGVAPDGAATLTVDGPRVADPRGRTAATLREALTFLPLARAGSAAGFDTDTVTATLWGSHALYGGGFAGTVDPRCEDVGCARVGPVRVDACAGARAGLGGVLTRGAEGKVDVRYRILARPVDPALPTIAFVGDLAELELVDAAGAVRRGGVSRADAALARLDAPVDGMTFGTPWRTLSLDAPTGAGPVGFALAVGVGDACGGPGVPPAELELLVEHVTAR